MNIMGMGMARDIARKSKTLKSYCHIVATLLYHPNASEPMKAICVRRRRDTDDCKETKKNKRALYNGNETDAKRLAKKQHKAYIGLEN